ncbi:hypothetical protein ACFX10_032382 [Malus domestica]
MHLLKDCPFAKCVWLSFPLDIPICDCNPPSPLCWVMDAIDNFSWGLEITTQSIYWWQESVPKAIPLPLWHSPPPYKWLAPLSGKLKLNVEGAWDANTKLGGYGSVVFDNRGCFVATKCDHFLNACSLLLAKAMAFRALLVWLSAGGFHDLFIESDSL